MKSCADADSISQAFIHPFAYDPVTPPHGGDMLVTFFLDNSCISFRAPLELPQGLVWTVCPQFLRHGAVAVTGAFTSLAGTSSSFSFGPDCWRSATIFPSQNLAVLLSKLNASVPLPWRFPVFNRRCA